MNPAQTDSLNRNLWWFFAAVALILAAAGFLAASPTEMIAGLIRINFGLCQLFTDFVAVGGFRATLVNVASVILFELLVFWLSKRLFSGVQMAIILMTAGFAFFGTSLFNMLPIVLGVFLYALAQKVPFHTLYLQAFLGSAIGPLINQIAFGLGLNPLVSVPLGLAVGIVIGIILPPLSSSFSQFHKGYNLYNIGFTAGIIGLIAIALLRMIKFEVETVSILDTKHGLSLSILTLALSISLIFYGMILNRSRAHNYMDLLRNSQKAPADFVVLFGSGITLINMGLMGLICLVYLKIIRAPMNGPIIGALFSVVGFAAIGKHPRNCLPVMLGVSLAALLRGDLQSSRTAVTALFSTTLAPLADQFGVLVGILAGFLHSAVVSSVVFLHGGVNLYNNGFSGGFVAAFLVPLLEAFKQIREKTSPKKPSP